MFYSDRLALFHQYAIHIIHTHPTLGKRFWSFIKSMKKDNVGISPLKENGEGEAVHDSKKKANLLSEQFKSVFTQEDLENLPSLPQAFPNISQLNFDTVGIAKLLSNLNVKKAAGPDQIPCWVLKNAAQEIAPSRNSFSHFHCKLGTSPGTGKTRTSMPSSKKETDHLPQTTDPSHIIFSHIMSHLEEFKILSDI